MPTRGEQIKTLCGELLHRHDEGPDAAAPTMGRRERHPCGLLGLGAGIEADGGRKRFGNHPSPSSMVDAHPARH